MDERALRLERLMEEIGKITEEIGPKLIRLSHLRKEVRMILAELDPEGEQLELDEAKGV